MAMMLYCRSGYSFAGDKGMCCWGVFDRRATEWQSSGYTCLISRDAISRNGKLKLIADVVKLESCLISREKGRVVCDVNV